MWGIDVSRHQQHIDWGAVTAQGIQFAILKVMHEKTHQPDERFYYNYEHASKYDLQLGAYIYVTATDSESARKEASDALAILNGRVLLRGVWLDVESSKLKGLGKKELTHLIDIEADVIETAGYHVGIYSNLDWYQNYLEGPLLSNSYRWWMARYPKNDVGTIELKLNPKDIATMWQYTSKGSVAGITGPVDLDYDTSDLAKPIDSVALQVYMGLWGNGDVRRRRLEAAGYEYQTIQTAVNKLVHNNTYYPQYKGLSVKLDDILKEIGVEPQFRGNKYKRQPLAEINDIHDYTGSLSQNLRLIMLARKGELKRVK